MQVFVMDARWKHEGMTSRDNGHVNIVKLYWDLSVLSFLSSVSSSSRNNPSKSSSDNSITLSSSPSA